MNKDSAKLYLPLVQALAEGKLQHQNFDGSWSDTDTSDFDHNPDSYRIKPEPFECWVNVYPDGYGVYAYDKKEHARQKFVYGKGGKRAVHMREVEK